MDCGFQEGGGGREGESGWMLVGGGEGGETNDTIITMAEEEVEYNRKIFVS